MREPIEKELHEQIERLAPEQQLRVLEFARALAHSSIQGRPGRELARFAGTIGNRDLDTITAEIEAGCEQVNLNEW